VSGVSSEESKSGPQALPATSPPLSALMFEGLVAANDWKAVVRIIQGDGGV
jgi:hypothetical protein